MGFLGGLFGGSSSKSNVDIFNESVNSAFMSNKNQCTSTISSNQAINIDGSGNVVEDGTMVQVNEMKVLCEQNSQAMLDFQANMEAAVKQAASAQSTALLGALQDVNSDVNTKIHNSVKNNITIDNLQEIANNVNSAQGINIHGNNNIVRGFNMDQTNTMIASNVQTVIDKISAETGIKDQLDQEAKSVVTNPISDVITSIGDAMSEVWSTLLGPFKWILILIIIIAIAYMGGFFGTGSIVDDADNVNKLHQGVSQRLGLSYGQPNQQYQQRQQYQYQQQSPYIQQYGPPMQPGYPPMYQMPLSNQQQQFPNQQPSNISQ